MQLEKRPLPKAHAMMFALRAYSALAAFRQSSAGLDEWCSLAESFNTVNALMCLGKSFPGLDMNDLKILYCGLRDARQSGLQVDLDASLFDRLGTMVAGYDKALQTMARRTFSEAMSFVDRCVHEQAEVDLVAGIGQSARPPMLTEPEVQAGLPEQERDMGRPSIDR